MGRVQRQPTWCADSSISTGKVTFMIGRLRVALKFFVYGLSLGILFAPRTGKESRDALTGWVSRTAKETLGL